MINKEKYPHKKLNKALNPTKDTTNIAHARLFQDKAKRIRVGDDLSPVMAGDPAPGGGTYKEGQYAPQIDDLAIQTFSSAESAGILPSGLPIFDENGNIDKNKLDEWNPNQQGIPASFEEGMPVYSSALIASSLKTIDYSLLENLSMGIMQAARSPGYFGNFIVSSRVDISQGKFMSNFFVYPDFFKYIDKPIIPKTPKRKSGISVSSFMVFHTVGHIVFSKLSYDGKLSTISKFLESSGWTKVPDDVDKKGTFMGAESPSAWYRDPDHSFLTELSRYSPMDDFAQAFAFYYTNNEYLKIKEPEKYEIISKIISEHV